MGEVDDDELARRAARGDRAAWDALLARHTDLVYAVCRRVVGQHDDALDAAQDALIAATRGIARFDGRSRFTTWLYRIATNAAIDELRRRNRRPLPHDELPERPGSGASDPANAVVDRITIDAALQTLPIEFRAAVALRDLADFDYAQIAEILDVPPGTVRSRIARGRAALAERLGNPEGVPTVTPSEAP